MEEIINELFEPCEALVGFLIPHLNKDEDTATIIEKSRTLLLSLINKYSNVEEIPKDDMSLICKIVGAHPRLGVPTVSALSDFSSSEQKSLSTGDPRLKQKLIELNAQYESTFPGLRFVVWVNGKPREEIMEIMKKRMERNSWIDEVIDSFNAMADIALDRFLKAKL